MVDPTLRERARGVCPRMGFDACFTLEPTP